MARDLLEYPEIHNARLLEKLIVESRDEMSGPGAISLNTIVTILTTTGADALTLADGVQGQIKIITMAVDGGDGTLTPANLFNGTTLTFGDVGDTVMLLFAGTEWRVLFNTGTALA